VFSGPVSTVDQPLPILPNPATKLTEILCTLEIDQAFTGQIPMTCTVSSGTVIFAEIYANYVKILNPVFTSAQIAILANPDTTLSEKIAIYTPVAVPPLSQTDIDTFLDPASTREQRNTIMNEHNCNSVISSGANSYSVIDTTDARSQVIIDGIAKSPDHTSLAGTWWWVISAGSTLAYQLDVSPAVV
jgi:hypothetical protein